MKLILRNILSVVRRFKLATTLNILGLSVAFAAFMVIMIQLDYDLSFGKCHKDYDKIFRVEIVEKDFAEVDKEYASGMLCRPLAERFFESSPHIVGGALNHFWEREVYFHVENNDDRNFYKEKDMGISPEFAEMFGFDFVEGSEDVLKSPENVIIPLSLSRKIFGTESAIGKQLISERESRTVGAVYRDFPDNTIVRNHIYTSLPEYEKWSWRSNNYFAFIRVDDVSNVPLLFDNFKLNFEANDNFNWNGGVVSLRFTPLPETHFVTDVQFDHIPKASRQTLMILFVIAIVIVVIAAINFTNFNMALTPMRVKSINAQRVLGAQRNTLRFALIIEAVVISFLSYLVAVLLVSLFNSSPLAKLVDADLSIAAHPLIIGGTALAALLTGLFAGAYPARYITSFAPALALKGSFGLSQKGKRLRDTLISIQYTASFALIISASFMYLQNQFMQNSSFGYNNDALITVDIDQIKKDRDAFTNQIKSHSAIEEVTYGQFLLSNSDDKYSAWGRQYKENNIMYQALPVHYEFLKVMGIEVAEGRDFRHEDANTQYGAYVFNETARKEFDLELNTTIGTTGEIIGFMSDIKIASFRNAVEPMAFYVRGTESAGSEPGIAYIRLKAGANLREAMSHVRTTLAEFDANYPFEIRFFDEVLQKLYEKETSLVSLISLFSLIAIFIAIVGVFGLVLFESECRRKEIGIRKVYGASTIDIILMFNRRYLGILAISFVIAAPLAFYAVDRWLQNFAYKTPMCRWVYLLTFIVLAAFTIGTVTFQNWRVANENPMKSIKTE